MIKQTKINQDYSIMPNTVLLSIKPEYADKIFKERTKEVELRRVFPDLDKDDLVIVYVSSPKKAVVGYFKIKNIIKKEVSYLWEEVEGKAGITHEEFYDYYSGVKFGIGIFFKKSKTFKKPVELEKLRQELNNFRPPQSYRYLKPDEWEVLKRLVDYDFE
ncbi:ASCH domain-containing protein [Okeania sp. SIO2C9]|uniref:ASCH domain-containing protein n=1 Tax=Okeania sp. SIO2C9 TaxID=2607791 RepID=UPI0025DCC952|nr:ASCH domain-containing protein [Okeania sp. SIO2C9]